MSYVFDHVSLVINLKVIFFFMSFKGHGIMYIFNFFLRKSGDLKGSRSVVKVITMPTFVYGSNSSYLMRSGPKQPFNYF